MTETTTEQPTELRGTVIINHKRMVDRLAGIYIDKSRREGTDAAQSWAARILPGNVELIELVNKRVVEKLNEGKKK